MTGRRLYDKSCDSLAAQDHNTHWGMSVLPYAEHKPIAWPFVSSRDRRVWNDLAKRLTPRKRA